MFFKKLRRKKFLRLRFFSYFLLFFGYSFDGATRRARAATHASVRIDVILRIALTYRAYGTSIRARTAGNTFVADFVCHRNLPPIRFGKNYVSRNLIYIVPQYLRFVNTKRKIIFKIFSAPRFRRRRIAYLFYRRFVRSAFRRPCRAFCTFCIFCSRRFFPAARHRFFPRVRAVSS